MEIDCRLPFGGFEIPRNLVRNLREKTLHLAISDYVIDENFQFGRKTNGIHAI